MFYLDPIRKARIGSAIYPRNENAQEKLYLTMLLCRLQRTIPSFSVKFCRREDTSPIEEIDIAYSKRLFLGLLCQASNAKLLFS